MIQVQFMKPYFTKVVGNKIRLIFAYQYFSIVKDDEVFHFIPIEGKEIVIDKKTKEVENLNEVFVFQKGNRFIRLPLYQMMLVSNIHEFMAGIIDDIKVPDVVEDSEEMEEIDEEEVQILLNQLTLMNDENYIDKAIDKALDDRNEEEFYRLVELKKNYK